MSAPSLAKLIISHLRGSVASFELEFEKGKKLTIIYGENGTGKSTICDALEFLGKGKVGSLDNRGLGKTNEYWTTISKTPADVAVTIETSSGACTARIVKAAVVAHPPEARPRIEVLRRTQILDLVEARPAERFATISRFIDVAGVESAENVLRKLLADLNNSQNLAAAQILANQTTIHQFWETAGKPGSDAFEWARAETSRDPHADAPQLNALRALQAAYARLAEYPQRLADADSALQAAQGTQAHAQQQAEDYLHAVAGDAGEVMDLLHAAQSYFHKHPAPEQCPLCQSADAAAGLAERIGERLQSFATLQQLQSAQRAAETELRRAEDQRELLRDRAAFDAHGFEQARAAFAWPHDMPLPTESAPALIDALAGWLAATADLPEAWNRSEAALQDQRQFLATLKKALETYDENMLGQQELEVLLPKLQKTLVIVEQERKAFVDATLRTIADEVGKMYEEVHPGEGLNKINMELDARRRASLDIATTFAGKGGRPPQAYFSESHLDTLGLCVFLALAKRDDPANTILVLDDVLASVDEPHIDRLINLLYNETKSFRHCVITTHYGPWRHKYKWGWLKNNQCQFVELAAWTSSKGITHIRTMPDIERLRALLEEHAPDPQLVCAKAGVMLEAALDFLTLLYECSVPRKPEPRYTLGELLPAIKPPLRKALRVEMKTGSDEHGNPIYTTAHLEAHLNELQRIAQARNVFGCHFNAISFDLLDTDALLFGRKVLELMEILADPEAGWPRNPKSGSYWSNGGETRRLYPLRQPS